MIGKAKRKIINDPVYGFISLHGNLLFEVMEHPYFQRLRRISQLGLTHLVYPGAVHTRFQHALGSMHLMKQALDVLKEKGHQITKEEQEGALLAILMHDIGHGPFSHALEQSIVTGINHEALSQLFFERLNKVYDGQLDTAKAIFEGSYTKNYLHQLVAGQLDVDRLDYLKRDSFFSGVSEGIVSSERIIKMLEVHNDELVVEAKGIYSIEKFIVARRLMYWQVYMHKTVLAAEYLLMNILRRARENVKEGKSLHTSKHLELFIKNHFGRKDLIENPSLLDEFVKLDDFDIFSAIKNWCFADDVILSLLSKNLINRRLYKIEMQDKPFDQARIEELKKQVATTYNLSLNETGYLVFSDKAQNHAYNPVGDNIKIKYKNNEVADIMEASEQINSVGITKVVSKYFLCYPKEFAPTE